MLKIKLAKSDWSSKNPPDTVDPLVINVANNVLDHLIKVELT
jgi:hypothetical protein